MAEEAEKVLSAARDGDIKTLQSLRRSVPFAVDSFGATAIHHASRYGKLECIRWMVEKVGMKAKVKAKNGATPLHDACTQGKLLCVKYFIQECNLNPDVIDNSGHTPLHLAARFGYLDIVKWLITKGNCNPRLKTMNRMNAAHFAAAGGHLHCLEFVISSGNTILLDERATDGTTPVFITTQNGHYPCLKYLHTVGANCSLRSRDGMHLIHAAAQNGNLDCIGYLVINGVASEIQGDSTGATPAHYAAGEGHVTVLKWLNKRCDLNVKDQLGGSPLHDAAEKGQFAAIQYLVENGHLNTKLKDKSSLTPIDLAEKHGHKRCYEYLRDAASKVNQVKAAKLMSYSHTFDKQSIEDSSGSSFLHVLKKKPRQMDRPVSPKSAKGPDLPPLDIPPEVSPNSSPIPCMIKFGKTSEWRKVDDKELSREHPHTSQAECSIEEHEDAHRPHLLDSTGMRELSPLNDEFWQSKNGNMTPTLNVDAYSHNAAGACTFDDRPDEELTDEMLEAAKTRTKVLNARLQNPTPSPLETFDARSAETDSKNIQEFSAQVQSARANRSPHNTMIKSDYHVLQPVVIDQQQSSNGKMDNEKSNEKNVDKDTPMECGDNKGSFEDQMLNQSPQTSPPPPKTLTDIFNNTNKDPTPVPSPKQSPRSSPVNPPLHQSTQSSSSKSPKGFEANVEKSPSSNSSHPKPPSPQFSSQSKSPSVQNVQRSEEPEEKPPSPPPQFKDRPASPPSESPRKISVEKNSNLYAPTPLVPLTTPSHKAPAPTPLKKGNDGEPVKERDEEPKIESDGKSKKEPEVDENEQPIDEENYMTTDDESEKQRSATPKVQQQSKEETVPLRQRQMQPLPHMNGTTPINQSPAPSIDQETWATLPEWKRQVLRNRIMKEQKAELEQRKQEELEKMKYADVPKWKLPLAKRKEADRINQEKMSNVPEWKQQLIMKKKLKRKAVGAWTDTTNGD